jgi:hypothetical protein
MTITEAKATGIETATDAADDARDIASETGDQTRSPVGQVRDAVGDVIGRVPDALESARTGVEQIAEHVPDAVERTRVTAQRTTSSLQTMPDTTLRMVAAASIGLSAGLSLAGAPRLVALVALVPAIFVGGAVATRPRTETPSS